MTQAERAQIIEALLAIENVLRDLAPGHGHDLDDIREAAKQLRELSN